jgi:hypothetical protein
MFEHVIFYLLEKVFCVGKKIILHWQFSKHMGFPSVGNQSKIGRRILLEACSFQHELSSGWDLEGYIS